MIGCVTISDPLCLIVEYCTAGDLQHFLREKRIYMIEKDAPDSNFVSLESLLGFALQVACGMEYLCEHKFVHRDLAARNVLLDADQNVKICDFGLCRHFPSEYYTSRGGRLPIKWMALESIMEYKFTSASDIWSFGILLFEIITLGGCPYPDIDAQYMETYLKSGGRMERPDTCPEELYNLMQITWLEDPSMRPNFTQIIDTLRNMIEQLRESDYNYLALNNNHAYYKISAP